MEFLQKNVVVSRCATLSSKIDCAIRIISAFLICCAPQVEADCFGRYHDSATALAACNSINPGCAVYSGNKNCGADHLVESRCPTSIAPNGYCATSYFNADSTDPEKNQGKPACGDASGNPIVHGTGNKFQSEVDIASQSKGLSFVRYYNSQSLHEAGLGSKWSASFLQFVEATGGAVTLSQADGRRISLVCLNEVGACDLDPDLTFLFEKTSTGYLKTASNDLVEAYDLSGRLLSITNLAGQVTTLSHDLTVAEGGDDNPDTLDKVEDNFGGFLTLAYDANGRIQSMTETGGGEYRYSYDVNGMLQYASYPDSTSGTTGSNPFGEDNPFRQYHYEDLNFPQALTGITDEIGTRFATWTYNSSGNAISSEHANGAEKVTVDYTHIDDETDPRSVVTNALGKQTTYHFADIFGARKVTQVEGHPSTNCAAANKNYSYDANGFVASKTDWKGNTTIYVRNTKGHELSRTEASGTPAARTVTTEWHPTFNLRTKVTEPDRETIYSYDANGNLLSQQTNDLTTP